MCVCVCVGTSRTPRSSQLDATEQSSSRESEYRDDFEMMAWGASPGPCREVTTALGPMVAPDVRSMGQRAFQRWASGPDL